MSRGPPAGPDGSTGIGTTSASDRGAGVSASVPGSTGPSSGACMKPRSSSTSARSPGVEPSETMRTSAEGMRPGILSHRVTGTDLDGAALLASVPLAGTLINVVAVLAGTAIGVALGGRLPPGLQQRV